jgi:hypothetical protein
LNDFVETQKIASLQNIIPSKRSKNMMNNRREFIKKGAIAGIALSGIAATNSQLSAQNKDQNQGKNQDINAGKAYGSISFDTTQSTGLLTLKAINICYRILTERTGMDFALASNNHLVIRLKIAAQSMPAEAF